MTRFYTNTCDICLAKTTCLQYSLCYVNLLIIIMQCDNVAAGKPV